MKLQINSGAIKDILKLSKADDIGFIVKGDSVKAIATEIDKDDQLIQIVKNISHSVLNAVDGESKINRKIFKMIEDNTTMTITQCDIKTDKRTIKYNEDDVFIKAIEIKNYLTTIQGSELKHLLSGQYAVDKKIFKETLRGICIDKNKFVALDGFRLSVREGNFEAKEKVIFNGKVLSVLNKIKTDKDIIKIYYNERYVKFNINNELSIICDRVEGDFIDYEKIIPSSHDTKILLNDTKDILKTFKNYNDNKLYPIKLDINKDNSNLSSKNELMNVIDELKLDEFEGDDIEIHVNVKYLIDTFKEYKNPHIEFKGKLNPIIFKEHGKLDLVLPVKVN